MITKTMREWYDMVSRHSLSKMAHTFFLSSAFVLSLALCQEKDGSMRAVSICTKS